MIALQMHVGQLPRRHVKVTDRLGRIRTKRDRTRNIKVVAPIAIRLVFTLSIHIGIVGLMDRVFEHGGTTFEWNEAKASENQRKHGVSFEEAVTVFDDPRFVLRDVTRNEEQRGAAIGFSAIGRLLTVVHIEFAGESIRIISAWRASPAEEEFYDQ